MNFASRAYHRTHQVIYIYKKMGIKIMIVLTGDHGGYSLIDVISRHLTARGAAFRVLGEQPPDGASDYPAFAVPAARLVADGECTFGVLVCGTGLGMSIAANKVRGIRAALCPDVIYAEMARRHNDANVLCLGARTLAAELAVKIVDAFLDTGFDGGRHALRVAMLTALDEGG